MERLKHSPFLCFSTYQAHCNAVVYRTYEEFNEERNIDRKDHKTQSIFQRNPMFLIDLKCTIEGELCILKTVLTKKMQSVLFHCVNGKLVMTSHVRQRHHLFTVKAEEINSESWPKRLSIPLWVSLNSIYLFLSLLLLFL